MKDDHNVTVTVTHSSIQNAVMKALQDLGIFCLASETGFGASHYEVAEKVANILLAGEPVRCRCNLKATNGNHVRSCPTLVESK